MITLRPDQSRLQSDTFQAWRDGHKAVVTVLPTGGGKSVIVSDTARIFDDNRDDVLVMAHRQELVGQMSLHLGRQAIRHRILAPQAVVRSITAEHRREFAGNCYVNPSARASVGGVDTILSRANTELSDTLKRARFVCSDEGHHVLRDNKWGKALALMPNALIMLPTASPSRADGRGLGLHADGIATHMNIGPDMRWLIDQRSLCDYEIICPKTDFDRGNLVIGASGEATPASMARESERSRIVGDVVEQYTLNAWGKRTVVFVTDVKAANAAAEKFNAWGIPAAAISANTSDDVRAEQIRRLRDGRLWVLVNVDLLGEGFDLPAIECVIMARPTQSLAVYLQQFGRALRVLAGKLYGLVIDLVSNVKAHSLPDIPRRWSLDRRSNRAASDPELVPTKICKTCTKPYLAIHSSCPHCGAEPLPRLIAGRSELPLVHGDLTRLDAETLRKMREAAELVSPERKAEQAKFASGGMVSASKIMEFQFGRLQAQSALRDAIADWAGYQRWKGRDDSEIHMRFWHASGMTVLDAMADDRQFEATTEKVRSWISF